MNHKTATISVSARDAIQTQADIVPWFPTVSLLMAAACLLMAARYGYRSFFIWRLRANPVDDPVIAKAIAGAKPAPLVLYAVLWLAAGGALIEGAFTFAAAAAVHS